jgi:uncharacterized circularly permuted ATP-grasp superfamily protein/uncharacterized alpha-E superfamily protein
MAEAESSPLERVPLSLSDSYHPASSGYDEMCSAPGTLRPHWRELMQSFAFEEMGIEELERRNDELQRLLQENGVTYNVHGDSRDSQRPWVVDPIPVLMTSEEWAAIETGLQQRAQLFNLLLEDLYGPHTIIRQGLLPPELIYAYPGFQRPCHESLPQGRPWLVFHAVDLARVATGSFQVLGDRTQSPAGAGYALENRIIMARAFPKLYRDAPLRRLAGFLEAERATLARLALHNQEHPHVALLTPGPGSESYFEHAYLANYLSLSLVEGQDLVVRDGRVWQKTLGGLRPVDVILRRVPDDYCDPLELRSASLLGVPGLLQAVRCNGVAVASALGCGVVENPGLLAFLPALCRHLLGEELRLPSISTWWCGSEQERDYVLTHLDSLVIRSILPGQEPVVGALLDKAAKERLSARIQADPPLFIAQKLDSLSTAPALQEGHLVPRPVMLRGFAVANQEGYRVMPGGLARVSLGLDTLRSSLQRGGISKDLWVLAPAPQKHISLLRQAYGPIVVTRDGSDLPSRVADNLYWLGRYAERLDGTARLLREALGQLLELQEQHIAEDNCLYDLLTALELPVAPFTDSSRARFVPLRRQLLRLLTDVERPGSLPIVFAGMMHNGRAVRDHLGDDSWRLLNRLQRSIQEVPPGLTAREARERLEGQLTLLAAFSGLNNETMPHHYGWLFLDIGRQLERVLCTLSLFKLAFVTATRPGVALWQVVLSTTDNLTAYRRRYRSALHPKAIIDLLLFDEANPRAIGYQVKRLQRQISRLPHTQSSPYRSAEERLILEVASILQLADIEALAALEINKPDPVLVKLLEDLSRPLDKLSDALAHSHFSHAEVPRQLIAM